MRGVSWGRLKRVAIDFETRRDGGRNAYWVELEMRHDRD